MNIASDLRVPSGAAQPGPEQAARMLEMITGYWISQLVGATAQFRIADLLGDEAVSATNLAERADASPDGMMRLLRACAAVGLVTVTSDGRFGTTPLLRTLADAPDSMRALAIALTAPGHWQPWGRFADAVRTGTTQARAALGSDLWQHYSRHPEEQAEFARAMTNFTSVVAGEAVRLLDLTKVRTVADIGGSEGALLHALLRAHPGVKGILFDQPAVAAEATKAAQRNGLSDRIQVVGGDFFAEVPSADLLTMKHILHDWNDDECVRILRRCAAAMKPDSRLVVIEQRLQEIGQSDFVSLLDLNMLVEATGRERTVSEYRYLFEAAGLGLSRVTETRSPYVFLEAMKQ